MYNNNTSETESNVIMQLFQHKENTLEQAHYDLFNSLLALHLHYGSTIIKEYYYNGLIQDDLYCIRYKQSIKDQLDRHFNNLAITYTLDEVQVSLREFYNAA